MDKTCSNCKWFKCSNHIGYNDTYDCLNSNDKLFKTDIPEPTGYCVNHEPILKQDKNEM
jgi:hypothetical protein